MTSYTLSQRPDGRWAVLNASGQAVASFSTKQRAKREAKDREVLARAQERR